MQHSFSVKLPINYNCHCAYQYNH